MLIVWDFNGVLVDDTEAHRLGFNAALRLFGHEGFATLEETRRTTTVPYALAFERLGITQDTLIGKIPEIDRLYHATYLSSESAFTLRRQIRETLTLIVAQGGANIILSNTRRDVLDTQLDRLGIRDYFTWISTSDQRSETGLKLNKAERLQTYCGTKDNAAEKACIIGDSTEEMDVARAFRIKSLAVGNGWFDETRLKSARPDAFVSCTSAIPQALRALRIIA